MVEWAEFAGVEEGGRRVGHGPLDCDPFHGPFVEPLCGELGEDSGRFFEDNSEAVRSFVSVVADGGACDLLGGDLESAEYKFLDELVAPRWSETGEIDSGEFQHVCIRDGDGFLCGCSK